MLGVMVLSQHQISLSETVRLRVPCAFPSPCGARCMSMILGRGLRFVQGYRTRTLLKKQEPICACTNEIAQHQFVGD